MKAKDDVLAAQEREKISEKQAEIRIMKKKLESLTKKHALIQMKLEKMEDFPEFMKLL
jgi:hypothetical protein